MPIADTPVPVISKAAQERVVKFANDVLQFLSANWNLRSQLLKRDLIYQREVDRTEQQRRAKVANEAFDPTRIQNVTVPVVQPQVDSAHSYLVETFLSSYPIFPVVSKPEISELAKQVDTVMGEASINFQYARQLSMCLKDGLKYNIMAAEVDWVDQKVFTVANSPQDSMKFGVPVETVLSGNKIKRLDMYNTILDTRVPPAEVHIRGEFAGYTELVSRVELKQRMLDLDTTLTMNELDAFQSGLGAYTSVMDGTGSYYVPQVNPDALRDQAFTTTNWLAWAQLDTNKKINYSNMYEVTTLYARIIPKEFGIFIPKENRKPGQTPGVPMIYKFIIVNRKVLIYCERKTNAHNMLPIVVGQLIEDGLNYQTKSFADNSTPYQQLSSALWNSGIQSQRRKVYDRLIYDPSRINASDISKADPVARIPVKTEAYGKPVTEAIEILPYRDEGVPQILAMAREVIQMGEMSTGYNRVQQGQFQKGNKTRQEFDTVMDKSEARPRTMAVLAEVSWFHPIKHILKYNILQYQPPGELFNRKLNQAVNINPADLRKLAWEFKIADGLFPVNSIINFEIFGQVMQFASAAPQFAAEWDIMGMYMYVLELQGADWVKSFKRQPAQATALMENVNGKPQGSV